MEKKILCLSWCDADRVINYGQILQALSMMKLLRKYTDNKIYYISFFPRDLKESIKYHISHYNIINGHLQAYIKTMNIVNRYKKELDIHLYKCRKESELNKYANVDIMICGSDQIWHPCNYDKAFFLDFGVPKIKRVAFAASLPKKTMETKFVKEYELIKHSIKKIDAISVREQSSVELVSKLASKSVFAVLDPTFLVEKKMWEEIAEPINTPKKYIFVYIPNGMTEEMVNVVNTIKQQENIDDVLVIMTRGTNLFTNFTNLKFVGLGEFLYLIKNASVVLTSSFHAVVFSILFHVDFYAYEVKNDIRGEDYRIIDLLKLLELEKRNIKNCKLNHINKIDFDKTDDIIKNKRKESIEFLQREIL